MRRCWRSRLRRCWRPTSRRWRSNWRAGDAPMQRSLAWLDPPPAATLAQARDLLERLEAVDAAGRATALGRDMATLGIHPRLAHMVLRARSLGRVELACQVAALLSERDPLRAAPGFRDPDLFHRVEVLRGRPAPPGISTWTPARSAASSASRSRSSSNSAAAPRRVASPIPRCTRSTRPGCCSRSPTLIASVAHVTADRAATC